MVNQNLFEYLKVHPTVAGKSANNILHDLGKRFHLTIQDVYDTKEKFKKVCPGAITKYRKGSTTRAKALTPKDKTIYRILLFDLETAPMVSYHWRRFKENIGINQTISESFIICYSAKWLYSNEMLGDCCTPDEAASGDDSRVCKSLWNLIDQADVVVAHNGNCADIPWMNSRFILNGLVPPSSYISVDTLLIAKKKFGFSSNKLDALAGYFDIDHKLDTDFTLWRRCLNGDKEALDYMYEYNHKDVEILEEVYLILRPWAGSLHPNMANIADKDCCVACGSEDYELIPDQYYITPLNKYRLFRCKHCGAVFHARKSIGHWKPSTTTCAH